jgi:ribosomal protein S18 acetylase RimI-like enzyme
MIELRKIGIDELSLVRDFPPEEWHLDLETLYREHYGQEYFYPSTALINAEIVGTGIAIVHENAVWLGTIIVKPEFRNQGIGRAVTQHLIDHARSRGRETILLAASALGVPVYKRIGFERDLDYIFFKADHPVKIESVSGNIFGITPEDYERVADLDRTVTGERRTQLLARYLKTGVVYYDDRIRGYYLPDFGKGLIIADSSLAGVELLKYRLSRDPSPVCVPETNAMAIGFLRSLGFTQFLQSPRMYLTNNVTWHSQNVYSRGCGYMG